MAVIKLRPSFKDYLWGGERLVKDYNKQTDLRPLAESWEVSTHPDGPSFIENGEYKGLTLAQYLDKKDNKPVGLSGAKFEQFPVLIKFIDALQDLSIQVHPDDEYGLKNEGEYGKTEMWYVLDAKPQSRIYYGTKQDLTVNELEASIKNQTILDHLQAVEVAAGDVIFVEAGTIHAIGAGIVVCEIQQNSNTTYRVYDYHRKDAEGNLRDLHVTKALEVSNLSPLNTSFLPMGEILDYQDYSKQLLVTCPYFTTHKIIIDGSLTYDVSKDSFEALVVLEGKLKISADGEEITVVKGESAFIDASTTGLSISGKASYLLVTV